MDEIHSGVDARQKEVSTTHCLIDVYHHLILGVEKTGSIGTLVLTDSSKVLTSLTTRSSLSNCLTWGCPIDCAVVGRFSH